MAAAGGLDKKRAPKGSKKKARRRSQREEEKPVVEAEPDDDDDDDEDEEEEVVDSAVGTAGGKAEGSDDDADEDGEDEESEEEDEEGDDDDEDSAKKPLRKTKANRIAEAHAKDDDEPSEPRGVIYIGHLPRGFFEPQMWKFFSQFGKVTRLRISRSKKNAQSKGYAFIEFEEEGVAKIVAETMEKYLLFEKTLVCHLVPKEKQHPALFKNSRRKMLNIKGIRRKRMRETYNDRPVVEVGGQHVPQVTSRQVARRGKKNKKLKDLLNTMDIDYDLHSALTGCEVGGEESAGEDISASPRFSHQKSPRLGAQKKRGHEEVAAPAAAAQGGKKKKKGKH